ncbi:MAG: VOC family protein [Planctomycetota bacterium]
MACIDHFYVFAQPGAPERRRLLERGLRIGAARRHPGQGTENVCFGFADSYLELIWIRDEREAASPAVAPLRLGERGDWRRRGASPFGVCLRVTPDEGAPFASWPFRPDYLPDGMRFEMTREHDEVHQPLLFALDRPVVPLAAPHPLARAALRELRITTPGLAANSSLRELPVPGLVFEAGSEHRMEVRLGDGDDALDLAPDLPLVLRW